MTELEIELGGLHLAVEVVSLIDLPPDPMCRDSADDFRGTRELEWRLTYATEFGEDGRVKQCGQLPRWLDKLARENESAITAAIWAQHDAAKSGQGEHHAAQ
jgi:hypothetical protein